jgi:hypothetical protein
MSTESETPASALEDYLGLFDALSAHGVEFVVIGGIAVGAYARLVGETIFSQDLDLLVTHRALESVVEDGAALGLRVDKLPAPRSVPVAVLAWRGREVNLITATAGMPPADAEARAAREFAVGGEGHAPILIADPFDLLRNKLAVNRPKDQPHISVLRRFLDEEVVHAFSSETEPRSRIGTAERLLEVLGTQVLEPRLAERLVPLARLSADLRFLAHRVPTDDLLQAVVARAAGTEASAIVERIAARRGRVGPER